MRYSRQRESIFHAVMDSTEHPTANMVYDRLKAEMPHLSLGTVYRNLNQLCDAGRLLKIPLPDGSCRFDGTTRDHSHIICDGCGKVTDVMLPELTEVEHAIEKKTDYTLNSYNVVMRGICGGCKTVRQ